MVASMKNGAVLARDLAVQERAKQRWAPRWKSILVLIARCIQGLMMVSGATVPFLHYAYLPIPNPEAGRFLDALYVSGLFDLVKPLELLCGLALVLNLYVPLAAVLTAPIAIVIAFVNFVLDPQPTAIFGGAAILLCNVAILVAYRKNYQSLLVRRGSL